MILNDLTLRYFTEFGKPAFHTYPRRSVAEFMHEYFVVRVRCHRKESLHSLSHLLLSFLYSIRKNTRHSLYRVKIGLEKLAISAALQLEATRPIIRSRH